MAYPLVYRLWLGIFGLATLAGVAVSTAQAPAPPLEPSGFAASHDQAGYELSWVHVGEQYSYELCSVEHSGDWLAAHRGGRRG